MLYGNDSAPVSTGAVSGDEGLFNYSNSPTMARPQQPDPNATLLTGGFTPPEKSQQKAQGGEGDTDTGPRAPIIDRNDNMGDPPASYDLHLSGFFDGFEKDAAVLNKTEHLEQLRAARAGLKEALTEAQIGDTAAREMFAQVRNYVTNPRSPERMESERAETMTALEKKWGNDTPKMIEAANKVFHEMCRKVPGLAESMIETGAANDLKTIVHLANIGKRRGYGKSMLNR